MGLVSSKDIVLELPVAVFHPATLPPPQPEPYPYPAPDIYSNPYPNYGSSPSPSPPFPVAAPLATPMPYAERAQSPLYAYPMTPPPLLPLLSSSVPAPLNAQLVIPPYKAYDGQLWFPPPPPTYVGGPLYNQAPPPRPASANVGATLASVSTSGLPISGTPDHLRHPFSYQPQQYYPPQPEQTTGHGTRAARISHHLRATSRARSVSPPPLQLPLPTEVEVEVLAPKPMPSPKIVPEMHGVGGSGDPFAQSFGRIGTRARSLSVVKLEEMAARAAAETEAEARGEKVERETAALDKTLPVPPVPSGKPIGYGVNRRLIAAQEIFHQREPDQEERGSAPEGIIGAQADVVPRTPPLSALSLLRPPPLHDQPAFLSYGERGTGRAV
ncbi:hypothetical protein B0F90DRAFT_629490 [Multifurca ochricompacta]|uniref:Uncharacterized protein n=1 Tax=Multifurca ochricompacta TaxID=376703 RepID=A0AAD4LUT3_9AGAM|nr:hypothetical protein B0F90DRAFT_629490 [Multifurca ochricompacta]